MGVQIILKKQSANVVFAFDKLKSLGRLYPDFIFILTLYVKYYGNVLIQAPVFYIFLVNYLIHHLEEPCWVS